ncbi:MAG: hypothetical protein WAN43_21045 [Rhodomicrobium sp.]
MSANKYLPHILILPEDDADRELAVEFIVNVNNVNHRQIVIEPVARGWGRVCSIFVSDHIDAMRNNKNRFMVLLLDFDGDHNRIQQVQKKIPADLADRVFILGALTDPEDLKRQVPGSFDTIGKAMADDCQNGTQTIWAHQLLSHNQNELDRLRKDACSKLP